MERLNSQDIEKQLNKHQDWKLTGGKWLVKEYRFEEYLKGIQFAEEIGQLSESFNHHPVITIDYKRVTIKLTTKDVSGLTELDFKMAKLYDEAFKKL
ncbi:4a-hydroxytetrahydrobiopterin dehydratase [Fictibacillus sp. Mic-4]|uniref:4a-hydroxytetrahydrobiopterin dehydratase n=1 Tax=Fictibacillus TaxID=1329200 RepID=UPI000400BE2B|nr:4a-hydroxytetrahydrobiopterin dehydratase [Fictibacillus gelatini]